MKPLFSIIVPVYNVINQLEKCVESLLAQTVKDYEIILVDDGSTDGSSELCDRLCELSEKIRCYHKKNGGLSDARNYGIERATGRYLLFVDSDDVVDKNFCKVLYDAHVKYDADIVSTELVPFYTYEELEEIKSRKYNYLEKVFCGDEIIKQYYALSDKYTIYHGLCMKSYKAELFSDLRFAVGRLHEDLFITYKLLDKSKKFVYINLPYYYYYQNIASITHNYSKKNFKDEADALAEMISYFSKDNRYMHELTKYISAHYLVLLQKVYGCNKISEVIPYAKFVISWLGKNLWRCKYLSIYRKMVIYLALINPSFYLFITRRIKKRNE